ncbi:MAG: hypothetical protein ACKVWV_07645 [Planctomycetota bacterium]
MKKKTTPKVARASAAKPAAKQITTLKRRTATQTPSLKSKIQAPTKSQHAAPLPDKRPLPAPRRPAAARLEPQKVRGRQKRKGS